jgi:YegS/Rv2252/BmrU family lipid kinase
LKAAIILNPISGTGGRPQLIERRIAHARSVVGGRGVDAAVLVTESADHAPVLARQALAEGAALVVAWGGDGTINQVASELAFTDVAFAVVPSGSGNGLARELKIPCDANRAFDIAFGGDERMIDAGEINGRLFFNIAGIGLDAEVAHRFAVHGLERRGFARYIQIATRHVFSYQPAEYWIRADGVEIQKRALVIALANGRQYGNGAIVAPDARLDDGRLELVVIEGRSAFAAIAQMPMLFSGRIGRLPGVTMMPVREVSITTSGAAVYHVDGEPCVGERSLTARIRPQALRVRVPSGLQA